MALRLGYAVHSTSMGTPVPYDVPKAGRVGVTEARYLKETSWSTTICTPRGANKIARAVMHGNLLRLSIEDMKVPADTLYLDATELLALLRDADPEAYMKGVTKKMLIEHT